jgi:hypothetical protein
MDAEKDSLRHGTTVPILCRPVEPVPRHATAESVWDHRSRCAAGKVIPRDHLMRVEVNKASASRGEYTATP